MDKNSFPILSESDIHSRLTSLFPGRITTEPSLRNPDYIKQAYTLIIEMLCLVDINHQNVLPHSIVAQKARFPEMHGTSIIRTLMLLKKCFQSACVEQVFTITDLMYPTVKRSQRFLSGLINYCLHVMSTRNKEDELYQHSVKFQKDVTALLNHRDNLKNEHSDLDCQRMSDELEAGVMGRQAEEKLAAARALAEDLERQTAAVAKLSRERDEEAALKEEELHGLKHVEARVAMFREEIVDTSMDQLEAEVKDLEEQLQRQEELVTQKQSRVWELQRQTANNETTSRALKEFLELLTRFDAIDKDFQKYIKERQVIKNCQQKKEEEVRALRSSSSWRKKLSELNDTLIKSSLVYKENEKHQEMLRHQKESELAVVTADVTTLEAQVQTLTEHHVDLKERLKLEDDAVAKRLQQLNEAIVTALDYIEDFRERALETLNRLDS